MAIFGRRKSGPAKREASQGLRHPGPDDDGVARVIPKAVWDGPQGDLLRKIGMSPDDPGNQMPTPANVQAKMDDCLAHQKALIAGINEGMPQGVTLVPWAMIPYSIWKGPHAEFVMLICDLFPCGVWNTMLLPDSDAGARELGLPKHLGYVPDGLEEGANRLLGDIRKGLDAVYEETSPGIGQGDFSALCRFNEEADKAKLYVIRLAHILSTKVYGDDAYARHQQLFGEALGWGPAG